MHGMWAVGALPDATERTPCITLWDGALTVYAAWSDVKRFNSEIMASIRVMILFCAGVLTISTSEHSSQTSAIFREQHPL